MNRTAVSLWQSRPDDVFIVEMIRYDVCSSTAAVVEVDWFSNQSAGPLVVRGERLLFPCSTRPHLSRRLAWWGGGRGKRDEINKQTEPKRRETKAARVPHAMIDDVCRPTNGGRIASALRLILSAEYATTADGRSISHLCLLRVGALHIFCFGPSWGGGVVLISSHS